MRIILYYLNACAFFFLNRVRCTISLWSHGLCDTLFLGAEASDGRGASGFGGADRPAFAGPRVSDDRKGWRWRTPTTAGGRAVGQRPFVGHHTRRRWRADHRGAQHFHRRHPGVITSGRGIPERRRRSARRIARSSRTFAGRRRRRQSEPDAHPGRVFRARGAHAGHELGQHGVDAVSGTTAGSDVSQARRQLRDGDGEPQTRALYHNIIRSGHYRNRDQNISLICNSS